MENLTPHQIQALVKKTADAHDVKVVTNGHEAFVLIYTNPKAKKPAYKFPLSWIDALHDQFGDDFNDAEIDIFGEPPINIGAVPEK